MITYAEWAWISPDHGSGFVAALRVGAREIHQRRQDLRLVDALLQVDHLRLQLEDLRFQLGVMRAQRNQVHAARP